MIVNDIDISVKRSKRKTVSIFVERDGSVSARVPEDITEAELAQVIKSKEYQIHRNIALWEQLNSTRVNREYVNGQSFLYLGRNYRLSIVEDEFKGVRFTKNRFFISKKNVKNAPGLFKEFYKAKLYDKLPALISSASARLGVSPKSVKVMELHNRWASCTGVGNLNFHWKCAMAPMDVLKYIVIHELAHLIHQDHSSAFWNEIDKVLPNFQSHHDWLTLNGAGMDL